MTSERYITPPTYTPTWEEFSDFSKYIEKIEEEAAPFGVCKVIPPVGWKPNEKYLGKEDEIDFPIQTAIIQHTTGAKGIYLQMHEELENLPIRFIDFKRMILDPPKMDLEDGQLSTPTQENAFIERKYWKNILFQPAIYASDIPGSLFDANICTTWNLQNLNTLLQKQFTKHDVCIPGVNSPFLYVGSFKSTFCWHTEDMELYSINYLHFGAPKTWYSIPLSSKARFESLARQFYPDEFKKCSQVLRHKNILISPSILTANGIAITKMTQNVGEFMITFPGGYHAGFNHGLNCAEATNFATKRWVEIGKNATRCECEAGTVNIDMDTVFGTDDDQNNDQQHNHQHDDDQNHEQINFDTYLGDFKIDFLRRKKTVSYKESEEQPVPERKSKRKRKKVEHDEEQLAPPPPGSNIIIIPLHKINGLKSAPVVEPLKLETQVETSKIQVETCVEKLPGEEMNKNCVETCVEQMTIKPVVENVIESVSAAVAVTENLSNVLIEPVNGMDDDSMEVVSSETKSVVVEEKQVPVKKKQPAKKKAAPKKKAPAKKKSPEKIEKPKTEKTKHHPLFAQFYSGAFKFKFK